MWDIEVKMMIPFDTLAIYPDDNVDEYYIEPTFVKIMKLLNVEFDVRRVIETLYEFRTEKSSVEVHYSLDSFEEFIILDTYIDPTDQLDFIYIMFRSKACKGGELRRLAHKFYTDTCEYNVHYEEGCNIIKSSIGIDFTKPQTLNSRNMKKTLKGKKVVLFRKDELLKQYNMQSEFYLNKPLDNKIAKMIFDTYSYFLKSVIYNLSTDDLYKIKNYPKDISLYIERLNDRISMMYFGKKQFDEEIYNVELKNPFYKRESK